jgi:hypothetical protein
MDVFDFRNHLIDEYSAYINSFINVQDPRIARYVQDSLQAGHLWPDPLIQLNPSFEPGDWIDDLIKQGLLHPECSRIFKRDKDKPKYHGAGQPLRLHKHQSDAIRVAQTGANYVLTTGTGSGKSLAYIVPIVDHVLRRGSGQGVQAIVVYPMNALANSQEGELTKFLKLGYPDGQGPVTFARYTGQESDEARQRIIANPPDIILTNYVMLELNLTRPIERQLVQAAQGRRFLVLDELHTYRGRQGADVALLVRRVRDTLNAPTLQCVGTSATLSSMGTFDEQRADVARVASNLFGAPVLPPNVIGETLRRATTERDLNDPVYIAELTTRVADSNRQPPVDYEAIFYSSKIAYLSIDSNELNVTEANQAGGTLDADDGRLYGLSRDELRYVLDPQEVYGSDFPGETFRVLTKEKELKAYGEFRTRRLVLEKWDEQEGRRMKVEG